MTDENEKLNEEIWKKLEYGYNVKRNTIKAECIVDIEEVIQLARQQGIEIGKGKCQFEPCCSIGCWKALEESNNAVMCKLARSKVQEIHDQGAKAERERLLNEIKKSISNCMIVATYIPDGTDEEIIGNILTYNGLIIVLENLRKEKGDTQTLPEEARTTHARDRVSAPSP